MAGPQENDRPTAGDFRLADWLVQPRLNRLRRGETSIQLEPKLMDVLVFLAGSAGEVVSKRDIMDAVWPELFITESVISRAIAGLRRALGDDARQPRFIETILKRGYRLIAAISAPAAGAPRPIVTAGPEATLRFEAQGAPLPFVVGQWVRGEAFYGRAAEIAEILHGNRNWLWLLGTRRIGKTSLLKQLEHLAASTPGLGFFPLFWDLQGADRPQDLHRDFGEALLDAGERLQAAGIALDQVCTEDLFESLGRLRRALRAANLDLLLLCDEVEELIHLNDQDPALLRKLRREMHSREGMRSVLASSSRLWRLAAAEGETSPFLDGFTPPLYLGCLRDEEARQLILQTRLGTGARPAFSTGDVERIRRSCGNHPYLIQLLCRRAMERDDVDTAIEDVAGDRAVSYFFAVDFELFSELERALLRLLAERPALSLAAVRDALPEDGDAVAGSLGALRSLGIVRDDPAGGLHLPNAFLRRWLRACGSTL